MFLKLNGSSLRPLAFGFIELQKGQPELVSTGSAYESVKAIPGAGGVPLPVNCVAPPDGIAPRLSPVDLFDKSTMNPH